MDAVQIAAERIRDAWRREIERAIDRVKGLKGLDEGERWFQREWYKAGARRRWSEARRARWESWRRKRR